MEKGSVENIPGVLSTLSYLDEIFGYGTDFNVQVESRVPSAAGLKSSSAFTLGIVLAYLRLNGKNLSDAETIRITAEASIVNGTSITGGADDISSSLLGGFCLANNTERTLMMRKEMEEKPVLILYSNRKTMTRDLKNRDFSSLYSISDGMHNMILSGHIFESMVLNGFLYGSILGIDSETIGRLYSSGAVYAGQSGKGPALFAIFDRAEDAQLARREVSLPSYTSVLTRFSNRRTTIEDV